MPRIRNVIRFAQSNYIQYRQDLVDQLSKHLKIKLVIMDGYRTGKINVNTSLQKCIGHYCGCYETVDHSRDKIFVHKADCAFGHYVVVKLKRDGSFYINDNKVYKMKIDKDGYYLTDSDDEEYFDGSDSSEHGGDSSELEEEEEGDKLTDDDDDDDHDDANEKNKLENDKPILSPPHPRFPRRSYYSLLAKSANDVSFSRSMTNNFFNVFSSSSSSPGSGNKVDDTDNDSELVEINTNKKNKSNITSSSSFQRSDSPEY